MQILGPDATKVGTIGRSYAKVRSTEVKIQHPANDRLLRQLTPREHARVKGVPEAFVEGLSITAAHEMLGQSILMKPFRALGHGIGQGFASWDGIAIKKPEEPIRMQVAPKRNSNDNDQPDNQLSLFA